MMRVAQGLALFFGIAFGVVGLALLVPGVVRTPATPNVVIGALACVAMSIGSFVAFRRVRALVKVRDAQELEALRTLTRFEADGRPVTQGLVLLIVTVALVMSAFSTYERHAWPAFSLTLALLLLCSGGVVGFLRLATQPEPMLLMDARGFAHKTMGRIPWSEIIGFRHDVRHANNNKFHRLVIGIRSPHRYLDGMSWFWRLRKRAWRTDRPRYGAIEIPLNMLGQRPEVIVEAARQFRRRAPEPWVETWNETLSDQDLDTLLSASSGGTITPQMEAAVARGTNALKWRKRKWVLFNVALVVVAMLAVFALAHHNR
jgi:hypothetical protein